MSEQLKELRAQRILIQAHLNWIDTQIAATEGYAPQYRTSDDSTTLSASELKVDQEQQLATGASDIRRTQIGCCLFFIGGILLFLFCLFGLPYLID
ncbi:MAG: hypothetical protein P8R37_08315 [Opitutae bacterium]|jgi:hypothetical protein|nr:hypothetical protein [Opitutae bacterium]MDG1301578.1 hypothetical protein [Opitutae bacterium]